MSLNFNVEPFYDDYSEDKQFYRILFRPGYAVQARELTQLQTILQQQIKRHADHVFKNGAMVIPGQISYDSKTPYVKLKANISSSAIIKTFSVLSSVIGKTYRGATSGVEAVILAATPFEVINGVTDADTLFVKYTRGTGRFAYGEIISPTDGSSGLDLQVEEVGIDANALGTGTTASIQQGVYYIKNNFVLARAQTTVLAKYSNSATIKAGLQVIEEVVYPEDDESILDNALGSPNYAAPGAARYHIDLILKSKPYSAVVDTDEFVNLLTLKDGQVQFLLDKTEYSQIEKTLARRTYDESGDYTVRDFPIEVREYRNNDRGTWGNNKTYIKGDIVLSNSIYYKCVIDHTSAASGAFAVGSNWLADATPPFNYGLYSGPTVSQSISTEITPLTNIVSLAVEPGKAYVRGYEIEKISTQYLVLDKARDLSQYETKSIDTSPGNYIVIKNANSLPSINSDVVFYDKYGSAGAAPSGGSIVATARIKQIQQHTTSPSLTYKVFLFNLSVNSGMSFNRDAKYAYSNIGGTAATNFSGRIVPSLVELSGSLAASVSSTTVTGINTTFIQDISQYDYVSIGGNEYQVTSSSITNNSITIDTAITVTAGTKISRVEASIYDPDALVSYYRIPRYATNDTQNLKYSFYKKTTTSSAVTSSTISEAGYVFGAKSDTKNYIVVDRSTGMHLTYVSSSPTAGQFTLTGDTTSSVTFTFGSAGTYDIIYNLRKAADGSSPRLKTLTNITETVSLATVGSVTSAALSKGDGFELIKVMSGTTDVTAKFSFDDGLRASHYDLCKIMLIPGQSVSGSVTVTYSYFSHSGSGDYFSVDSYTHAASNIQYYELTPERINAVDFRVLRNSDGTYSQSIIPKYGEETDIQYNYYYGRIDKLSLDTTGQFVITKGIPSAYPAVPASPSNSMDLYTFNVEPYTFTGSTASVVPSKIENKRYTMNDIGRLESRIKNLEYYTSLSLLEQNTINARAYDVYGLERPQNGFLVDDFTGQGVGAVTSLDWKASIDSSSGELRPFYTQTNISLLEDVGPNLSRVGRNYEVNGDLVTLKIASTTPLVSQARASHSESVNPFNIFTFAGSLEINPWNDTWFEVNRRPDIIINDTSQYDAVVSKALSDGVLGTVYRAWSIAWQGERVTGTQRRTADRLHGDKGAALDAEFGLGPETGGWAHRVVETQSFANTGTKTYSGGTNTFIRASSSSKIVDDRVISTAIIPYMRSRKILFRGDNFKPETQLFAFFDNINVDSYIAPAKRIVVTSYGSTAIPTFAVDVNVGSNINNIERKTSGEVSTAYNYGEVLKEYSITNNGSPVLTGSSCIVLGQETYAGVTYAYIDNIIGTLHDNSGSTTYYLQAEFDSTRKVQKVGAIFTPSSLTSTRTGLLFGVFTIPNSSAMSFRTGERQLRFTDNAANIRKNESTSAESYYSAKGILETKERTILSTKTASVVTEKIADRTETIVTTGSRVVSDTGWYDPLAQTFLVDIDGGAFITDVDLFFSAKDEGVPIKIQIRNVVNGYPGSVIVPFSEVVKRPSDVTISNNATASTKFKFKSPVYLQGGIEYALVVLSDSAKYRIWIAQGGEVDVNGSGLISSAPYAGVLFKSQNASTWTADQTQDMKFNINRAVFDTASTASLRLVNQHVNNDVVFDLANINISKTILPNTKLDALLNNVNGISNNNVTIGLEEDIIFDQSQKLKDYIEENGTPSFSTTLTLSSTRDNISPVVNLGRCSATLISNVIDSIVADNETYPEIGSATAKYVTKQVKLNQSSTHLRIMFDSNVPNDAWIDVYYKTGLQSSNFADQQYIKVPASAFTKPLTYTENSRQFYEVLAELNLDDFDIVQLKIVLKSTNTSKVPRVKALRVISYA